MIGNNDINLCEAEVMAAFEFYLNERVLRDPHKVIGFSRTSKGYGDGGEYTVKIQPMDLPDAQSGKDSATRTSSTRTARN